MKINRVRHLWPEDAGFKLVRENGTDDYVLLHFINSVNLFYSGKIIKTKPNSFIAFPPNTFQSFSSDTKLLHNWAHISGNVDELFHTANLKTNTLYSLSNGDFITEIFREIETEHSLCGEFSSEIINLKLNELVYKLARNISKDIDAELEHDTVKKLSKVRSAVFSSLNRKWQVSQMAQMMYISESHFYKLYSKHYGITPNKDLILARIDRAKTLIESGMRICDVAECCGYDNEYHFIHQFKKYVGVSPKQYSKSKINF